MKLELKPYFEEDDQRHIFSAKYGGFSKGKIYLTLHYLNLILIGK